MMDWQPIETAPKDGSVFLCYLPRGHQYKPYAGDLEPRTVSVWLCSWSGYTDRQGGIDAGWIIPLQSGVASQGVFYIKPTLWQPLPSP